MEGRNLRLCFLVLCLLVKITGLSGFELRISPRQVTVHPGERTSILCRSSVPLTKCRFLLPGNQVVNLDKGAESASTAEYRYYGRGLINGQCGITLTTQKTQSFTAVACQGRTEHEGWKRAAMFLRVTNLPTIQWDIDPQQTVSLNPGQNVSLLCLSDVPLLACRFGFMKDDGWLDLSQGKQSKRTREYAYYGSGLEDGQCGITLYQVTEDMSQELRCIGIGENQEWVGDFFSLAIAKQPDPPKLVVSSDMYNDGASLVATCTVARGRPAAHITWYLGDHEVRDVITDVSPDNVWFEHEEQTVAQRLTRRLSCGDDDKVLSCQAGPTLVASKKIHVTPCRGSQYTRPAVPVGVNTSPKVPPPIPPNTPQTSLPSSDICGVALLSNELVVNGQQTVEGHWPWIVAIFVKKVRQGGLEFLCGGTLISRKHVITAAHCVSVAGVKRRPDDLVLFLGKFNLNDWTEPNSQLKKIQSINVHPAFISSTNGSDIAVISLAKPATYNNYVRPICMWNKGISLTEVIGAKGSVVGWGRFGAGDSAVSDTPRLAKTVIVAQDECLRSHQDFIQVTNENTFCAGYKDGSGPCNGDSGSGLVLPYQQCNGGATQWFLRGVVSLALLDNVDVICDLSQYVVYTDVAKYADWLSQFNDTTRAN